MADEVRGESSRPTAVYRLYDEQGMLVYVGITGDPDMRLAQHATGKHWWPQVTRQTVEWYAARRDAEIAEQAAIKFLRPRYNAQHAPEPPTVKITVELNARQVHALDLLRRRLTADLPGDLDLPREDLLYSLVDRELAARGLLGNPPCYEPVASWPDGVRVPWCAERFPACRNPDCTATEEGRLNRRWDEDLSLRQQEQQ